MRMWIVDPKTMCRRHLLGEHVECHMFAGTIERGISVKGYLDKGLLETHNLQKRHDVLAIEMQRRGYQHQSPLNFSTRLKSKKIDAGRSATELHKRCVECRELWPGRGQTPEVQGGFETAISKYRDSIERGTAGR